MAIVIAKKSFAATAGGARHEVHEGDQLSDSHPTVQANPTRFSKATEKQVAEAVREARPQSDRRE